MMVCHCSLAGTQACKNCSRYKEYFGEQIKTPRIEVSQNIYLTDGEEKTTLEDFLKRIVKEAVREALNGIQIIEHPRILK